MNKRTFLLAGAYLALLASSRLLEPAAREPQPGAGPGRVAVVIRPQDDRGPLEGPRAELSLLHWRAPAGAQAGPPLVCLHGSPGSARNFERLGARLAAQGREVWALDLPGFGRSRGPVGGYSILAHARALLAVLDTLGVERVHLVGWSMGGGVALHAAELAGDRIASVTLMASIGVQETEGSGSFVFEHTKYLALRGLLFGLDRLVPHFGTLSVLRRDGRAFALNFWETDQRPLRAILAELTTPALILHGREDVLVPLRTAQVSHELVAHSRLVVLDANHFLPVLQVEEVAAEVLPFLERHDVAGVVEPRSRAEPGRPTGWRGLEPDVLALGRAVPWWLQGIGLALAAAGWPFLSATVAGTAVAAAQLDFGLVALFLALGALAGGLVRRRQGQRRWLAAPLRVWGWMLLALTLSLLLVPAFGGQAPRSLAPLAALVLLVTAAAWLRARRARPSLRPPRTLG